MPLLRHLFNSQFLNTFHSRHDIERMSGNMMCVMVWPRPKSDIGKLTTMTCNWLKLCIESSFLFREIAARSKFVWKKCLFQSYKAGPLWEPSGKRCTRKVWSPCCKKIGRRVTMCPFIALEYSCKKLLFDIRCYQNFCTQVWTFSTNG